MSISKLIFRSLQFYWRGHLGVFMGTILASTILTGALIVGDSVRYSLRHLALARLGQTTLALTSGDRFFRADLACDLGTQLGAPTAPLLILRGAVTTSEGVRRANEIQVLGVDERFWNLSPKADPESGSNIRFSGDEIAVSESLAKRLQLKIGDTLVVRLEQPGFVTRDLPLAGQADSIVALRLQVGMIVGDEQFGRFSLHGNQVAALSVFVALNTLQHHIQRPGRANALLIGQQRIISQPCDAARANSALAGVWKLSDADLELRVLPGQTELELRTKRVFIDPVIAEAALVVATNGVGVLTYFVNEIRLGDRATPYSFVGATSLWTGGVPLRDDEIAINTWLADDLGAKQGSEVTLRYFVIGDGRELVEKTATFQVREILPLKPDASWIPDFPGLADTENCREWKPGIPINLDNIRPKDEIYWKEFRGTPKAFVSLAAGQRLWSSRFGNLTAIRFAARCDKYDDAAKEFERALLGRINPATLGFAFTDVRAQAMQAAEKSRNFGHLFLGLSFFLIVAALLLTALLYVFNLEQRNAQVGLLLALGYSGSKVRSIFLIEGAWVAGMGTLMGLLGAVLFAKFTLHGLATVWRGAVGASSFLYHAETTSLITGATLSLFAAIGAMALVHRGQIRCSQAALLASGAEVEIGGLPVSGFRRHLGIGIGLAGLMGAFAMASTNSQGDGPTMAECFFCSGLLVLCAGLAFASHFLIGVGQAAKPAQGILQLGWRNAGRRRNRSLVTIAVLAAGVFMIVAVDAFRQNPRADALVRRSGTGGFALYGQSTMPIYEDLNSTSGRGIYNLTGDVMRDVTVVPLRIRDGDDASCLNLNRALQPRLFSVQPDELKRRQSFAFKQSLNQKGPGNEQIGDTKQNPWDLLNPHPVKDLVPAIGDEQTVRWALGKALGDTIDYTDDRGRPFKVRIVAILASSIFQGGLLISERDFIERFPSVAGYRAFLVDAPPGRAVEVSELLSRQLQDKGLDIQSAWQRLADFMVVENTYLGIFQALGGLGMLLGSLGLGIVVMRNVMERRNELALLQAVGFRPFQLQQLLLSEHWLLVVLGLFIGLSAALVGVLPALAAGVGESPLSGMGLTLAGLAGGGIFWCWLATRAALSRPLLDSLRKE